MGQHRSRREILLARWAGGAEAACEIMRDGLRRPGVDPLSADWSDLHEEALSISGALVALGRRLVAFGVAEAAQAPTAAPAGTAGPVADVELDGANAELADILDRVLAPGDSLSATACRRSPDGSVVVAIGEQDGPRGTWEVCREAAIVLDALGRLPDHAGAAAIMAALREPEAAGAAEAPRRRAPRRIDAGPGAAADYAGGGRRYTGD